MAAMPLAAQSGAVIAWSEDFSVGIPSIDDQHKVLVSLIARLQQAMAEGRVREELAGLIEKLVTYTQHHFAWEEQLLEAHAFEELSPHRDEHARLTAQVLEFQEKVASGRLALGTPVYQFLTHWLADHIVGTDKRYGIFLAQRGVR
jgi:hemerythrin-like metal-binding protein